MAGRSIDREKAKAQILECPIAAPVLLETLKPHPRNYREHPADQIEHLCESIREHGFYRNLVIAQDGTILAGHGVAAAARQLGLTEVQAVRLPIDADSPAALKVLTGDNELEHLAEQDDRRLSELLKEISEAGSLLGTGFDEQMLANLAFVTRPAAEIATHDAAAHWVGMPAFEEEPERLKLVVSFASEADRARLLELLAIQTVRGQNGKTWSIYWPERQREDLSSLRFEAASND